MSFLRRLSTARLLALAAVAVAAAAAVGAAAVAASGGDGATPPAKPLAQALHDAAAAPSPAGITARATFTNDLFPSGSLLGGTASPLVAGASGRLWASSDGRGRLELQSDAGDVQLVWTPTRATLYDASTNTVYRFDRPAAKPAADTAGVPGVEQIRSFLDRLAAHATVSGAVPTNVAGRPAYSVTVSPARHGGLLGSGRLAWDAEHGVPLKIAVTARGSSAPVLQLAVTDISYGPVSSSAVDVAPPAGARVVDLGGTAGTDAHQRSAPVTGVPAVRAAVPFALVAPGALGGKTLSRAQLVGKDAALLVFGRGLDALVVLERPAGAGAAPAQLGALPKVSLGSDVVATELATPLGTVLRYPRNGVAFVVGGSLPQADVEAAARTLAAS